MSAKPYYTADPNKTSCVFFEVLRGVRGRLPAAVCDGHSAAAAADVDREEYIPIVESRYVHWNMSGWRGGGEGGGIKSGTDVYHG